MGLFGITQDDGCYRDSPPKIVQDDVRRNGIKCPAWRVKDLLYRAVREVLGTLAVGELLQRGRRISIVRVHHYYELDDINAALAAFDFGDEGLAATEFLRGLHLGQARLLAGVA